VFFHQDEVQMKISENTPLLFASLLLIPFVSGCSSYEEVNLAADVDRNGTVSFRTDDRGEDSWTLSRGAVFLT